MCSGKKRLAGLRDNKKKKGEGYKRITEKASTMFENNRRKGQKCGGRLVEGGVLRGGTKKGPAERGLREAETRENATMSARKPASGLRKPFSVGNAEKKNRAAA